MTAIDIYAVAAFVNARLTETEAMALAAVDPVHPGTHWHWALHHDDTAPTTASDTGILTDPSGEHWAVYLATVEETPSSSDMIGDLPGFLLPYAEEVPAVVAAHITRHDPAHVLAQVAELRLIVSSMCSLHAASWQYGDARAEIEHLTVTTVIRLARSHADHPDYDPARWSQ